MGNLLKVLCQADTSTTKECDIFVDFENAKPTIEEEPVCTEVGKVLTAGRCIITNIQGYAGATDDIRQAISNPRNEELQEKAWQAVCPLVAKLKSYYEFSGDLEKIIPRLLGVLCSNEKTPRQHLETQQALFKQFAEVLEFVFIFDEIKMTTPSIQNDFSYYRRTQNRSKMANEDDTGNESVVSNEVANRMSLFYAHATPMLKVLSDATTRFVSENKNLPVENTTDCLATMAKICRVMIDTPEYVERFQNSYDTKKFCLRVMVGVIILYDHVHPLGAFVRQSSIEMKSSIKVLKDQQPSEVEGLLNALRYTTKHLNDETTPKAIKTMLAV